MKKFKIFILIINILYTSGFVYAYDAGESSGINYIFCPQSIDCDDSSGTFVCTGNGEHSNYWNIKSIDTKKSGHYIFKQATSQFHISQAAPRHVTFTMACHYAYSGSYPFPVPGINLYPKEGSQLVIYNKVNNNWPIDDGTGVSRCDSDTPELCPMSETASMMIYLNPVDESGNVIDNREINLKVFANNSFFHQERRNPYYIITKSEAEQVCGMNTECKIYIQKEGDFSENYGYVTIAISDVLKIVDVVSFSSNSVVMKKSQYFNSVVFEKLSN